MGAIAEAITSYAQVLIDATDGSMEEMNRALALGQLCWNLALVPEDKRDELLATMRIKLAMEDAAFEELRRTVVEPMILRHKSMFPQMHQKGSPLFMDESQASAAQPTLTMPPKPTSRGRFPGTGRYDP